MRKDSCHLPPLLRAAVLLLALSAALPVHAVPGDVLFLDNFERAALGPWTTNNGARSGILAGVEVSLSPTRGAFTRRGPVTVTSPVIAAAVPAAEVSLWVRRGSDAFSEFPDGGENLAVEYQRANGTWGTLRAYPGGGLPGEIFNDTIQLPPDALHGGLAIRMRQTGGSNGNFDWWHFDDVRVTETVPPAAIGIGACDDFESGLAGNWTVAAGTGAAGVSSDAFQSPLNAMILNGGTVTVTSVPIDTSDPSFGDVSLWLQRGSDAFSEDPDTGEDLIIEYLDDTLTWVTLEAFIGNGTPGQIFTRNYAIPAAGRHAAFQLRFRQTGGSGPVFDFWHIDDVCLNQIALPTLQITKVVETLNDPINGTTNPKAIPGAVMRYTIEISNQGPGQVDANTFALTDVVPAGTELFVDGGASDAVTFTDGAVTSGLAYSFATDVRFSNQAGGGPPYTYVPSADPQGFDSAVTGVIVEPSGTMNGAAGGANPSFTLQLNVRVQ